MNIDYTTTALIASVKQKAMIPNSQQLYQDSDVLTILTDELFSDVVPLLMSIREEYLVTLYDQSIVTSQASYVLPPRAFGQKLRDAVLVNSAGREISMPRSDPDDLKHVQSQTFDAFSPRRSFYFQDDAIVIFPDATTLSPFTLRMKYFRRPNNLVATSAAGQITIIDSVNKVVTVSNFPAAFTASQTYDIIKGTPSFKSRGDDLAVTSVDSTAKTLTFTATLPTGLAVNDWVCLSGQSPIAQIPYEAHQILAQRVVVRMMSEMGDQPGLQAGADVYKDMVEKFKIMVTPRADGSPKRLVRSNFLFGGGRRRNGW